MTWDLVLHSKQPKDDSCVGHKACTCVYPEQALAVLT